MAVDLAVELFLDGDWVDITPDVRVDPGLTITFGVPNESATADPSTCTLTVNNRDGKYSPRNPAGPYYGHLTRNTPLRVLVGSGPDNSRFAGEVSEFPGRWNLPGTDVWTPLVASGVLRRLARANALDSTLVSGIRKIITGGNITGYWPMEDQSGSTYFASGMHAGGPPATFLGSPVLAAVDPLVSTNPIPTFNNAGANASPAIVTGTGHTVGFLLSMPEGGTANGAEILRVQSLVGTIAIWVLTYETGGLFRLRAYTQPGGAGYTEVLNTVSNQVLDGNTRWVTLEHRNVGANVQWNLSATGIGTSSGTILNQQVGAPSRVYVGYGLTYGAPITGDVAIGHLITGNVFQAAATLDFDAALRGYAGETTAARMTRVAALAGIPMTVMGGTATSTLLGPQPDGTALDVMRAAEAADVGGILRESITEVGLVYMTRSARYSRAVQVALDYEGGDLSPPLEPTDDDANVRNDVTVTRIDGTSVRTIAETGPLNAQEYPDGVGPYPYQATLNLYTDSQVADVANWILTQGTIDETRWPQLTVDLVKNADLVAAIEPLRPGYRLTVDNLPDWSGAESADLHAIGWTEFIGSHRRLITFNCVPGGEGTAYNVLILDDLTYGVLDSDNHLGM